MLVFMLVFQPMQNHCTHMHASTLPILIVRVQATLRWESHRDSLRIACARCTHTSHHARWFQHRTEPQEHRARPRAHATLNAEHVVAPTHAQTGCQERIMAYVVRDAKEELLSSCSACRQSMRRLRERISDCPVGFASPLQKRRRCSTLRCVFTRAKERPRRPPHRHAARASREP